MAPRDGGSTESLAGASTSVGETIDWPWIDNLDVDGGKVYIELIYTLQC
jgi:hypothetical protein